MERRLDIELGSGEREAIALALEKKISTFLTNDEDAYHIGKILGLEPRGVLYLLLKGVKEQHHNKKKESLREMLEESFWLSPTIIHKFHESLAIYEKRQPRARLLRCPLRTLISTLMMILRKRTKRLPISDLQVCLHFYFNLYFRLKIFTPNL